MANDSLKTLIDSVIYANLNNEINATDHSAMLKTLVQTLGWLQMRGVATVATNPSTDDLEKNFFYFAGPGTYNNLGSITVDVGELAVIGYSEGVFTKYTLPITAGSGGGNTFSSQFRLIDDVVWWDPSYISASYGSGDGTRIDYLQFTTDSDITGNYIVLFYVLFDTNHTGNLSIEISGKLAQAIGETLTLEVLGNSSRGDFFELSTTLNTATVNLLDNETNGGLNFRVYTPSTFTIDEATSFIFENLIIKDYDTGQEISYQLGGTIFSTVNTLTYGTIASPLNGTRVQHLILEGAGIVPTIPDPTTSTPEDETWLETDILEGEIAFNRTDLKVFYRLNDTIYEFGSGGSIVIDDVPTSGSTNAVSSGGVYDAFNNLPLYMALFDGLNDTNTPSAGAFRLNNTTTQSAATELYLHVTEYISASDNTEFLNKIKQGSAIKIYNKADKTQFIVATLTGDISIASSVATLPITINSISDIDDGAACGLIVIGSNISNDISIALSDEITDLTTDNDASIEVIRDQTIQSVTISINTAPVGSSLLVDILKNGISIMNTVVTLPASSLTVTSSDFSDASLSVGDIVKFDVTQVGATTPGAGLKAYLKTILS